MYERGQEIAERVIQFIRENQFFDGLDDEDYDDAMEGFFDGLDAVNFESTSA